MPAESREKPVSPDSFPKAAEGLKGRELAALALEIGEEVLPHLNETQSKYFEARARRAGVQWPEGFFQATIEELTK